LKICKVFILPTDVSWVNYNTAAAFETHKIIVEG